jgi:uncharacterized protein YecT (DUF1311 family)
MADCVEKGIYDPCDAGGGPHSWAYAQCGFAHLEVAERRIKHIEQEVLTRLTKIEAPESLREDFLSAQEQWKTSRDKYCATTSRITDIGGFEQHFNSTSYMVLAFCLRRVTEERVQELQRLLDADPY